MIYFKTGTNKKSTQEKVLHNYVASIFSKVTGFDYYVDIHIEIEGQLSVTEGHRIVHLVKDALLESNLRVKNVLVHVEPF